MRAVIGSLIREVLMVADVAELAARFRRSADSPECRTRRADDWVVRELTVRDSALIHPGT